MWHLQQLRLQPRHPLPQPPHLLPAVRTIVIAVVRLLLVLLFLTLPPPCPAAFALQKLDLGFQKPDLALGTGGLRAPVSMPQRLRASSSSYCCTYRICHIPQRLRASSSYCCTYSICHIPQRLRASSSSYCCTYTAAAARIIIVLYRLVVCAYISLYIYTLTHIHTHTHTHTHTCLHCISRPFYCV